MTDEQEAEMQWLIYWLGNPENAHPATAFPLEGEEAESGGVYAWHGDEVAREAIRSRLGYCGAGPLYIGRVNTSFNKRIVRHDMRNTKASPLRKSLAAVLWDELGLRCPAEQTIDSTSESELMAWMSEHLSVVIVPVGDVTTAKLIEDEASHLHDPPLNLTHVYPTPYRRRLRRLRSRHLGTTSEMAAQIEQMFVVAAAAKSDPGVVVPISRARGRGSRRSREMSSRHPARTGIDRGA